MQVSEFYDLKKGSYSRTSFLDLLNNYDIETNKKYSQNFIWNLDLLQKFVHKAGIDRNYKVLEIGSGAGTLSYVLSQETTQVVSIELDSNLEELLNDIELYTKLKSNNLSFIFADANTLNWQDIYPYLGSTHEDTDNKLALVSNLPYNLTSSLIAKAIKEFFYADKILLLVEDNAVPRILGKAGDGKSENTNRGFLNKLISVYGNARSLLRVSKNNFYPKPRINSELILIEARKESYSYKVLSKYSLEFYNLLKLAFSHRRKSISNCLLPIAPKDLLKSWIEAKNLKYNVRAEEIFTDDFADLLEFLLENNVNLSGI